MHRVFDPVFERVERRVGLNDELDRRFKRINHAEGWQFWHLGSKAHVDMKRIRTRDIVKIACHLTLVERLQDDVVGQIDQGITSLNCIDDGRVKILPDGIIDDASYCRWHDERIKKGYILGVEVVHIVAIAVDECIDTI